MRVDGYGLGCHVWDNGDTYWLDNPSFDPDVQLPGNSSFRIACGCER
jgi:hypothetical protein